MTDLNPMPNNRLVVDGVIGYGNVIFGAIAIVAGLWASVEPLIWIGGVPRSRWRRSHRDLADQAASCEGCRASQHRRRTVLAPRP